MSDIVHIKPKTVYRFICMRRCGHHAIMRWLYHQLPLEKVYRNDVTTRKDGLTDEFVFSTNDLEYNSNILKPVNSILSCECYMFNHEDEDPFITLEKCLNTDAKMYNIVVLRDMKNLFASRLKCGFVDNTLKSFKKSLELYKKYEDIFLEHEVFPISYNDWFTSKYYRQRLTKRLGVKKFDDTKFSFIPTAGGGSSFDKRDYHKKADKMLVLERWKEYENHEWFKEYIL